MKPPAPVEMGSGSDHAPPCDLLPELTGIVDHHLSERVHHASDEETNDGVTDEGADGTTVGESTSGALRAEVVA